MDSELKVTRWSSGRSDGWLNACSRIAEIYLGYTADIGGFRGHRPRTTVRETTRPTAVIVPWSISFLFQRATTYGFVLLRGKAMVPNTAMFWRHSWSEHSGTPRVQELHLREIDGGGHVIRRLQHLWLSSHCRGSVRGPTPCQKKAVALVPGTVIQSGLAGCRGPPVPCTSNAFRVIREPIPRQWKLSCHAWELHLKRPDGSLDGAAVPHSTTDVGRGSK